MGMGNANTVNLDEWAIFNNVAGISALENRLMMFLCAPIVDGTPQGCTYGSHR